LGCAEINVGRMREGEKERKDLNVGNGWIDGSGREAINV